MKNLLIASLITLTSTTSAMAATVVYANSSTIGIPVTQYVVASPVVVSTPVVVSAPSYVVSSPVVVSTPVVTASPVVYTTGSYCNSVPATISTTYISY